MRPRAVLSGCHCRRRRQLLHGDEAIRSVRPTCCGSTRTDATGARHVLLPVVQHVDQHIADLARRGERARMVAIAPYATVTRESAIDGLRRANREALDASR